MIATWTHYVPHNDGIVFDVSPNGSQFQIYAPPTPVPPAARQRQSMEFLLISISIYVQFPIILILLSSHCGLHHAGKVAKIASR
jgi:hypothetical protein